MKVVNFGGGSCSSFVLFSFLLFDISDADPWFLQSFSHKLNIKLFRHIRALIYLCKVAKKKNIRWKFVFLIMKPIRLIKGDILPYRMYLMNGLIFRGNLLLVPSQLNFIKKSSVNNFEKLSSNVPGFDFKKQIYERNSMKCLCIIGQYNIRIE